MAEAITANHEFDQHDLLYQVADKNNPLPRSVHRREDYRLLDGKWKFALDTEDRGLKEQWYIRHNYTVMASFPGSIESYFEAVKDFKDESTLYGENDDVIAWYETEFAIPEEWDKPNKLTQLTF